MHTEGSIIFSNPEVYDQRSQLSGRFVWQGAVELLDVRKSEPSRSSLLELFTPYQQSTPPLTQEILPDWLDLSFSNSTRIDSIVNAALAIQPLIDRREFQKFIENRARMIQNIAAFLVANMTFSDGDLAIQAAMLASNTLAYHLSDETKKAQLVELFHSIGESVAANTNDSQRLLIKRSPLPPAAVAELHSWLCSNITELKAAVERDQLLAEIAPIILRFATSRSINSISDQGMVVHALQRWVSGQTIASIFESLRGIEPENGWLTFKEGYNK